MKVLITGGAGFIGSHLAKMLLNRGMSVIILDDLSTGMVKNVPEGAVFYQRSITDHITDIFDSERPDKVIHLAAQVSVAKSLENPTKDAAVNIMGGLNLLKQCVNYNVDKMIYASTAAVYGDPIALPLSEDHPKQPLAPYGINKWTFEHYLESYRLNFGLDYTVLRYANVYGPDQLPGSDGGVVAIFVDKLINGEPLCIFGDGDQTRDFIYVEDACRANYLALDRASGQMLNIGGGVETSINYLAEKVSELSGTAPKLEYKDFRPGDIYKSVFQIDRAKESLGFSAEYDLETGLKLTLQAVGIDATELERRCERGP